MNYEETLDYLFNKYPVFERSGGLAYKPGLETIEKLLDGLGNPHLQFKSIHVAGTNGKGSTCHFLTSICMEAGYKTGLFTSPHLKDFNERIRIDGKPIEHERIVSFVEKFEEVLDTAESSFFEISTAMAFWIFAQEKVDIAIIETGMGGRLDATNVLRPELCIITNVGKDHMQFLGNTCEEIAYEKAGIIKSGIPVIIGQATTETKPVFMRKANHESTEIYFAENYVHTEVSHVGEQLLLNAFSHHKEEQYSIGLKGHYQAYNVAPVLLASSWLMKHGWKIQEANVWDGLLNIQENVPLKGRWQILHASPLVICDIAHNADGWKQLLPGFNRIKANRKYVILGFSADKEIEPILSMLPQEYEYIFSQAHSPRALSAMDLKKKAESIGIQGRIIEEVNEALNYCLAKCQTQDAILIAGSNYLVAELNDL
ncbi:MAG: bifunctional folylpolyglutamate synthase/dihydrofolate synthase [Cytophagaceae bacterium]|jgi:dihydrofolate synthase/folylpolyglutamate synthase|nr:bifunctional folylpolyglutamate synthase/dihydrofolate synthase [Cytophagaceae bacterium]